MKFDKVIKHFGSQVAAAEALQVTQPTISNWKKRGKIPHLQQVRIEQLSGGALKAEPLFKKNKRNVSRV